LEVCIRWRFWFYSLARSDFADPFIDIPIPFFLWQGTFHIETV